MLSADIGIVILTTEKLRESLLSAFGAGMAFQVGGTEINGPDTVAHIITTLTAPKAALTHEDE